MKNNFYIKGFDGLRAISIIMVLLTHLGVYDALLVTDFKNRIWHTVSGDMGVYVFFVISGFLITTLLLIEKSLKGKISFKRFIARRFLRLLPPLVFFYITIAVLMNTGVLPANFLALGISVFYLYNFIPNKFFSYELGHTWSLGVEEQFYLLWPFVIKWFQKKSIIVFALVAILLSAIAIKILPEIYLEYKGNVEMLGEHFRTQRWFLPAIAPVMTGSFFAVIVFYYKEFSSKYLASKISLLISFILILSAFYIPINSFNFLVLIQGVGIAMLLSFIYQNQNGIIANILEWKPLSFIGKISYGIYVWQGLFLRTGPGGDLWIQQFPQNISLTFLIAIASYFLIEKRVKSLRERLR